MVKYSIELKQRVIQDYLSGKGGATYLAKLHNKYKGGKNKLTTEQVAELNTLRKQGMPIARIAKQFKITRPTVYSYLRNEEK